MVSDGEDAPLLELRLFGRESVFVRGQDITRSLPKKAVLLLALLALREGQPLERTQVAVMLWPDVSESAALHNLRQMLAGLRRLLDDARDVIHAPSPRTISFNASVGAKVDVVEFDALCSSFDAEDLERAISLHHDPLLVGCEETFAMTARAARQQALLNAADRLAEKYQSAQDIPSAIRVLRRILAEDPYRETACRSLMTALTAAGQWPAALACYAEFRTRLRRDLRSDVSVETKVLIHSIKDGAAHGVPKAEAKRCVPSPLTELVGRKKAIADVVAVLEICRLVTLAGPGGIGKTRLAIAVANNVAESYLDGAYFVDLSPIQDGQTIPMAIATALGVKESAGKSTMEALNEHLFTRELLLVLDNCEHVSREVAAIVEQILISASGLRVIATSRQVLGVRGELVWSVPGLNTSSDEENPGDPGPADAVRLFMKRARRSIDPSKEKDLLTIASICCRLDGLPLAIELAAARTSLLSLQEIEQRLDDRFALLTSHSLATERHQTLLACMEWSWEMLTSDEKSLLMSLATFRGGCTLDALQSVAPEARLIDQLDSLIDKSLVGASEEEEETRYLLLETVREFADEKLKKSGEWVDTHDRFANYFLAKAEEEYRPMKAVEEADKFRRYERDHDNLRAAIAWFHRQVDRAKAIRLCTALARFWDTHGHLNEGRSQLEFALSHEAPELSDEARGRAFVHVGWMASVQGESQAAIAHFSEARILAERRDDRHALGVIFNCLANSYVDRDELEMATESLLASLEIRRSFGNKSGIGMILCNLAEIAFEQDDVDRAMTLVREGIEELGGISLDYAASSGTALRHLAFGHYRRGEYLDALDHGIRSFKVFKESAILFDIPFAMLTVALAQTGLGNWEGAVQMFAAAERLLDQDGTKTPRFLARARAVALAGAQTHLSPSAFLAAKQIGNETDMDSAIRLVHTAVVESSLG